MERRSVIQMITRYRRRETFGKMYEVAFVRSEEDNMMSVQIGRTSDAAYASRELASTVPEVLEAVLQICTLDEIDTALRRLGFKTG